MLFSTPAKQIAQNSVLSYATEMSRSGLLSNTNSERTSRGLGSLALNSKLNQAAQNKANDMVARNYWSHNTPDGQEPWIFFDQAGYSYTKAGENLAYGFATSSATVTGWMNSPGHRANILDSEYQEVGFGFANASNYVSTGENTIVVAMYAKPQVLAASYTEPTPAPAPSTAKPAPKPAAQSTPVTSEPVELPAEVVVPQPIEEATEQPKAEPVPSETPFNSDLAAGSETNPTTISRIQAWTKGSAPWSAAILSLSAIVLAGLWIAKHALIVKRALIHGEEWALHHPLIDFAVLTFITAVVYLTTTSGIIR